MVTPEHAQQVIETYCKAETAKDRDTWLSLFTPDATHEDPVGAPVNQGIEAIGAFFDAGAGADGSRPAQTAPPIVVGDEALAFLEVHVGHGAERLLAVADRRPPRVRRRRPHHRVARVLRPGGHRAPTRSDPGRDAAGRRLHARSPRERPALAPVAHRGELGRLPARRARARARACSTSAAARARSPSTSRSGSRRRASSGSTAPTRCSTPRARQRDAGVDNVEFADGRRVRARPARRVVRRRARAPGAPAPHRSGRRAARDASGVHARTASSRRATPTTPTFTWWPEDPRLTRWLDAVPRRRAQQRRRARRRPAPARVGARRRLLRRSRRPRRRGASPHRRTAPGGAACGPTASWPRRSPTRRSTRGLATRPSSRTSAPRGGRGASHPTRGSPSCTESSAPAPG